MSLYVPLVPYSLGGTVDDHLGTVIVGEYAYI